MRAVFRLGCIQDIANDSKKATRPLLFISDASKIRRARAAVCVHDGLPIWSGQRASSQKCRSFPQPRLAAKRRPFCSKMHGACDSCSKQASCPRPVWKPVACLRGAGRGERPPSSARHSRCPSTQCEARLRDHAEHPPSRLQTSVRSNLSDDMTRGQSPK